MTEPAHHIDRVIAQINEIRRKPYDTPRPRAFATRPVAEHQRAIFLEQGPVCHGITGAGRECLRTASYALRRIDSTGDTYERWQLGACRAHLAGILDYVHGHYWDDVLVEPVTIHTGEPDPDTEYARP